MTPQRVFMCVWVGGGVYDLSIFARLWADGWAGGWVCGWMGVREVGRVGGRRRRTASEIHARELKKKTDVDEEEAKFMLEYRAKRVQEMQEEVRGVRARMQTRPTRAFVT